MTITTRNYRGANDLYKIQKTTANWIASNGFIGRINVQDIALRLFAGMIMYDPQQIVRLWEDAAGNLIGWAMLYPVWNSFEVQVHPDDRYLTLENDIIAWAEHEVFPLMQALSPDNNNIQVNVFDSDSRRQSVLEMRGYTRGELILYISTRPLDDKLPQPQIPDGFSIRSITGKEEADKIVTLINAGFGWDWRAKDYQKIMQFPGYTPTNERVVVAPDGRFASSCFLLPDTHNRTSMFENVVTHPDFRRLGLAKALLQGCMQVMKHQGFTVAQVPHHSKLGPAQALYSSVGFERTHGIYSYTRKLN